MTNQKPQKNITTVSIILLTVFCCTLMALVEIFISPPYFVKSAIKIALFLLCPLGWAAIRHSFGDIKRLFIPSRRGLLYAALMGVAIFIVIFGGYFLLGSFFDLSGITASLISNTGVGSDNFVFVSLYIAIVNSLLEEFFFRGFAHQTLCRTASRRFAYIFSSLAFSLYHVSMMIGWFGLPLYLLILAALFVGGLIFNFFNEKYGSIYPSWMIHMCANFAINGIGMILFNMI